MKYIKYTFLTFFVLFSSIAKSQNNTFFVTKKGDTTFCDFKTNNYGVIHSTGKGKLSYYTEGEDDKKILHIDTLSTFRHLDQDYDIVEKVNKKGPYNSIHYRGYKAFFVTNDGDTTHCRINSLPFDLSVGLPKKKFSYFFDDTYDYKVAHIDTISTLSYLSETYDVIKTQSADGVEFIKLTRRLQTGKKTSLHQFKIVRQKFHAGYMFGAVGALITSAALAGSSSNDLDFIYYYYLTRNGEKYSKKISKGSFKYSISEFMKDCPLVVEKVKRKVYQFS